MSAKLTKALEYANYRVTLNNQHAAAKLQSQNLLSYSVNGGTFLIDYGLINFCHYLITMKKTEAILLDSYENPIKVELKSFLEEITSRYFEATNNYYAEYERLKLARKTHKILDINEN